MPVNFIQPSFASGKLDFKTPFAQLFEQNVPVVALDLYHTVFYRATRPALCLELSFKFLKLRLIAGTSGNYRNAFAFAPFCFSSNPHYGIGFADGFFPAARTARRPDSFDRPAALGTHPSVGG